MNRSKIAASISSVALVAAMSTALFAADTPVALRSRGADTLQWTLPAPGEWVVRMALPSGEVSQWTVKGEELWLASKGLPGGSWADGTYVWEAARLDSTGAEAGFAPLSGSFRVSEGEFYLPMDGSVSEDVRGAREDQMVADDLIVDGKACVGLACVANEVFSSETLRLKQSVVRLRFEDTSTAALHAARDWQIRVNESGSGGVDRFSIEDLTAATTPFTIFGGAPNNSLVVGNLGRVGIGTAVPATLFHIFGTSPAVEGTKLLVDASAAPAGPREMFELRNNGVAVFIFEDTTVPERWGFGTFGGSFAIDNQAAANIEYQFGPTGTLGITGSLGVGCGNPGSKLVVGGTPANCATAPWSALTPGTATFTTSSSRTLKLNLQPVAVDDILQRVRQVGVYTYDFIDGPTDRLGLVAEEFHSVFGRGPEQQINGGEIEMALWLAVQELAARNENLATANSTLRDHQAALEARLAHLETLVGTGGKP